MIHIQMKMVRNLLKEVRIWLVVSDRLDAIVKLNVRIGQKYRIYKQNNVDNARQRAMQNGMHILSKYILSFFILCRRGEFFPFPCRTMYVFMYYISMYLYTYTKHGTLCLTFWNTNLDCFFEPSAICYGEYKNYLVLD